MKKKLQLRNLLELKDNLETEIEELEEDITKYNNTEISTNILQDKLEVSYIQLIIFKEAIQTANKSKHKDGKTNNYYIYLLSNLKRKRNFYYKIDKLPSNKKTQITVTEINDYLRTIEDEMKKVRDKLTFFNDSKITAVEFNETYSAFYHPKTK